MCNKFDTNISAKSKPYSKMLKHVILKPRWVSIITRTGGQKARDTVPLTLGTMVRGQAISLPTSVEK